METAEKPKINLIGRLGEYGRTGGPGRPRGRKDDATLIKEAELALCKSLLGAQPDKRFYKRWLKNFAQRHPERALKITTDLIGITSAKEKGDTHLHFNLAQLVAQVTKKEEEINAE